MTKKRKRRKPEQIVQAIQEGEAILAAGKTLAEVYQTLGITESTWLRWKEAVRWHEVRRSKATSRT